jgi:hypothetical protein
MGLQMYNLFSLQTIYDYSISKAMHVNDKKKAIPSMRR